MKKGILPLSILTFLVAATFTSNAQKISLNVSKGQKMKVLITSLTKTSMSVMGQDMESNMESKATTQIEVLNNEKGTFQLSQKVTNIKASGQTAGQEMNYDSELKDDNGPLAQAMGKILNKESKITVDANGKVLKQDKASDEASSPMMPGGFSNVEGIAVIMQSLFNQDMKVGNAWKDSILTEAEGMKTKTVSYFKVASVDSDIATIAYTSNVTLEGTMEQSGQELTMTNTSENKGTIKVNIKTGLVLENTSDGTGTGTMEAAGMSIPSSTISKIVIKMIAE